jgi:hypothetical protein
LLLLVSGMAALSGADLAGVHTVYMLPMAHGFEQYLANCLARDHVFTIVTDPKMSDAVLSEHIGAALQEKLDIMLAPPPPEKPEKAEKTDDNSSGSLADAFGKSASSPAVNSTVGRSKGTLFLVDTKSRQVVWSTYELPKDATSKELDRIASAIVSRLKKDMGLSKK